MSAFITTIPERCRMCYTCVRECPAKAIRIVEGQAAVVPERCIACGNCVRVCSQAAKQIRPTVDPVIELATLDPLHIDLLLPAQYFGKIRVGQDLLINAEPAMKKSRKARVTTVDPLIDPASGSFTVRMELPNPDDRLVGGVNCVAEFAFDAPLPGSGDQLGSLGSDSLAQ